MIKKNNILGIDRGSKYIGIAYASEVQKIPFPIGYFINDSLAYYNIGEIIQKYQIKKIIIGYPSKQKDVQEKIKKFIDGMSYTLDRNQIVIETIDEDYSSVEAGDIISDFKKNAATDTVSAMVLLEKRFIIAQI